MADSDSPPATLYPVTEELLKDFLADYQAGRLPPETQQRLDEARDALKEKLQGDVDNLKSNVDSWVADFKETVTNACADILQNHPEVQELKDLDANAVTPAEAVVALRETIHSAIDVSEVVQDFVQDVVHDALDTTREVIVIRADADETGTLTGKVAAAMAEVSAVEARFDSDMEHMSELRSEAHEHLDAVIDGIAEHPQEYNAQVHMDRMLTNEANKVEPDSAVVGETAEA